MIQTLPLHEKLKVITDFRLDCNNEDEQNNRDNRSDRIIDVIDQMNLIRAPNDQKGINSDYNCVMNIT